MGFLQSSLQSLARCDLSNNRITGEFPFSNVGEMPKLVELKLTKNLLTGPNPLYLSLPSLAQLDLSNNNFSSVKVKEWKLRESGLLILSQNNFSCPLPAFEQDFRIDVDKCQVTDLVWVYVAVGMFAFGALVGAVVAYMYFGLGRLKTLENLLENKFIKTAVYVGLFVLSMVDDILGIIFFTDVQKYLDVTAEAVCTSYDAKGAFKTFGTYIVDDEPFPASYTDFQDYIRKLQEKVSTWGAKAITAYKEDCKTLTGCEYNENEFKCAPNPGHSPENDHESFKVFLYAVFAIYILKELVKLVVILVALKRGGKVPKPFRKVCRTSSCAPLLLCRGWEKFEENIILHKPSVQDEIFVIFYEGVCENFLQLPLSLWYAMGITKTGLNGLNWASVLTTCVFIMAMLIKPVVLLCSEYKPYKRCKRASQGKQDLNDAKAHADQDDKNVEMATTT